MEKISQKLQKKLESLGVKIPEDLYIFRIDRDYYKKLTDEEMGELFHFYRENNRISRIIHARRHGNRQDPDVRRGKIYLADLDPVIGSEQGDIRPVLILQNDHTNKNGSTVIVAAITRSRKKDRMVTHVRFHDEKENTDSCILLEQIRSIDKSRLLCCISEADHEVMRRVDAALAYSLYL